MPPHQLPTQHRQGLESKGVALDGQSRAVDRLIPLVATAGHGGAIVVRRSVRGVERDGPIERAVRDVPIPVQKERVAANCTVGFGQRVVERKRAVRGGSSTFRDGAGRHQSVERNEIARVGQAGVRQRERWVALERPLKERYGFGQPNAPLVPEVPSLQIELVRLQVSRDGNQRRQRVAKQLHLQHARDRARDLILHGEHVGVFAVVSVGPEMKPVFHGDQLR